MGQFKWKHRRSHRNLFNLSGIEIRDAETGRLMSKSKIREEYEADLSDQILVLPSENENPNPPEHCPVCFTHTGDGRRCTTCGDLRQKELSTEENR